MPNPPPLRPEVRAALLSGAFQEAAGAERAGGGHSLQGALCELYRQAHPDRCAWLAERHQISPEGQVFALLVGDGEEIHRADRQAPWEVLTWAGLPGGHAADHLDELEARGLDSRRHHRAPGSPLNAPVRRAGPARRRPRQA